MRLGFVYRGRKFGCFKFKSNDGNYSLRWWVFCFKSHNGAVLLLCGTSVSTKGGNFLTNWATVLNGFGLHNYNPCISLWASKWNRSNAKTFRTLRRSVLLLVMLRVRGTAKWPTVFRLESLYRQTAAMPNEPNFSERICECLIESINW